MRRAADQGAGEDGRLPAVTIRHVLLDADGVLQRVPGNWYALMEPYVGDRAREFFREAWSEELPMLSGRGGDYLPVLAAALLRFGVEVPAEQVYAEVWHRMEVDAESVALVKRLRDAGYGVHLGTNQESRRGAYMKSVLGYDDLFDVSCYSYELGVAKPDPGFFVEAARLIGAEPAEVLFVDDTEHNVLGARSAGMPAVHWSLDAGHEALAALLAGHGVGRA